MYSIRWNQSNSETKTQKRAHSLCCYNFHMRRNDILDLPEFIRNEEQFTPHALHCTAEHSHLACCSVVCFVFQELESIWRLFMRKFKSVLLQNRRRQMLRACVSVSQNILRLFANMCLFTLYTSIDSNWDSQCREPEDWFKISHFAGLMLMVTTNSIAADSL